MTPQVPVTLEREDSGLCYRFQAMASTCEVHINGTDPTHARAVGEAAEAEARRIERKFSRYRDDSIVTKINRAGHMSVPVGEETAQLLDFAAACYETSGGLFDITSGVLRRAWRFDGSDRIPTQSEVDAVLGLVGWNKVEWHRPILKMRAGMEIDLGGLGKEYAVDCALAAARALTDCPVLVNFGGDLRVSGPRRDGLPWTVALESVEKRGSSAAVFTLAEGALATSGDLNRYLLKDGVRYSHILDPRTGWPVASPPRSVTVAAATCIEAGMMATFALLHGQDAEAFLEREGITAWCMR